MGEGGRKGEREEWREKDVIRTSIDMIRRTRTSI